MSGYLRTIPFSTEFDGDKVTARLKPLLYKDLLKIQSLNPEGEANERALETFQEILPSYVEDLVLLDNAGQSISIQDVCSHVYFVELVAKLGNALVEGASVKRPQMPAAQSDT